MGYKHGEKRIDDFAWNTIIPYLNKEKYVKNLSHKKLAKLAMRILFPETPMWSLKMCIFDELLRRLDVLNNHTDIQCRLSAMLEGIRINNKGKMDRDNLVLRRDIYEKLLEIAGEK